MKKKKPFAAVEPYLWLLPSILLMTVFILFPIFEVFRTSMSEVSKAGLIKSGLFPCLQCIYLMPADNLRILLYKPFPLAGADGNAVAAGEVYRVPVDALDVSRVDEKPLMA